MKNFPIKRFLRFFSTASDCWEWEGAIGKNGYGRFQLEGKSRQAHRVAYEMFVGPFPEYLNILHRCDNRKCVKPSHLFLGTAKDNGVDMSEKGRSLTKAKNGNSPMEEWQYDVIIQTDISSRLLAKRFGISQRSVNRIRAKYA